MPNEKNLIPMDQRSQSEARELGRKGGKASGASRRRKRALKESADLFFSLPVSDKRAWNKIARTGVDPEDIDNQMMFIIGMFQAAVDGDARAGRLLVDLLGDDPRADSDKPENNLMDALRGAPEIDTDDISEIE